MKLSIKSTSYEHTKNFGTLVGQNLRGGEVIELKSDLGGGKTTFTHGLAAGINSKDRVASPTFTISKRYEGDELKLHHFDFYRLSDPGLVAHELEDVLEEKKSVVVVEWAGVVKDVLPKSRLAIEFIPQTESARTLEISYPASLRYLVVGLK